MFFDTLFHKTLKQPYKLAVSDDIGEGIPVVFLHGIASSSITWRNVLPLMPSGYRAVTIDLLGFGDSPKPDWAQYTVEDHARAVAKTIKKLHLKQKPIIVGHSMGSLIATSLASRHPELVNNLVLCSMPIYVSEDSSHSLETYKKTDAVVNNAYFKAYQAFAERPDFTLKGAEKIAKLAGNDTSFRLDKTTWIPFKESLKNTIERQNTMAIVAKLTMPIAIVYGRFDILVISKYFKELARKQTNITLYPVNSRHEITPNYAKKVVEVITNSHIKHNHTK